MGIAALIGTTGMSRKRGRKNLKHEASERKPSRASWMARARFLRNAALLAIPAALAIGFVAAATRVEAHVRDALKARFVPRIEFVDLPDSLVHLAAADLRASVDPPPVDWTEEHLCSAIADRVAMVGWVADVRRVRRRSDGRIEIACRYRTPGALIEDNGQYLLLDLEGVRLPGRYSADSSWPVIRGARGKIPAPGERWDGDDLRAGLNLSRLLAKEPFRNQLTAVDVSNYRGRIDPRKSHLELATDQAGGRIRWGSAPGFEMEENSIPQKLELLRANYRTTGRVDGGYLTIDVSTFPDRYTVPSG